VVNVPIGVYRGFRSLTDAPDALCRVTTFANAIALASFVIIRQTTGDGRRG
jgi:hypothetical protein